MIAGVLKQADLFLHKLAKHALYDSVLTGAVLGPVIPNFADVIKSLR